MMFWKKHKGKIVVLAMIVVVLAAAFWYGSNTPGAKGIEVLHTSEPTASVSADLVDVSPSAPVVPTDIPPVESETAVLEASPQVSASPSPSTAASSAPVMAINPDTGEPAGEGSPVPVEPEDATITSTAFTCTISVSCATILDNMSYLDTAKHGLDPPDGWLLEPDAVTIYEGESVFDVLQRTLRQNQIHMEFVNTIIYNSAYIEGIHNLYEFDVGEGSGWMYKVNDWFPNYGCSRYQLRDGDVIEWVYTCDLGYDVGGGYATGDE